MRTEAYALRDWAEFIGKRGKRIDEGSNQLLSLWRESHALLKSQGKICDRQIERKLRCVFLFHKLLPEAMPFDQNGNLRKICVGKNQIQQGIAFPITNKFLLSPRRSDFEVWSGSSPIRGQGSRRRTPNEAEVQKVLEQLRTGTGGMSSKRQGKETLRLSNLKLERDWCIARCEVLGGLRAAEVASLGVQQIIDALNLEGIRIQRKLLSKTSALDTLTELEQQAVLERLDAMLASGKGSIAVQIVGKGNKLRRAPFSIELIRDLLDVAIWTVRKSQIHIWSSTSKGYQAPDQVFLSFKSHSGLESGSVGDLVKDAFNQLDMSQFSGQRLRAHFCNMLAIEIWDECFAANGYRFDQVVENLALERLAEAMGHERPDTTVRSYLDRAILRSTGFSGRTRLNVMKEIWNGLVKQQEHLQKDEVCLIKQVIVALSEAPLDSDLHRLIEMALTRTTLGMVPQAPAKPSNHPKLTLVSDLSAANSDLISPHEPSSPS
jgi:integrase